MFNSLKMKKQLANLRSHGWMVGTVFIAKNNSAHVNARKGADTVVITYTPKRSIKTVEGRTGKTWNGILNLFPFSVEDTASFMVQMEKGKK